MYSNCGRAELFLNGNSLGVMQRDSQDFPAAGLRWKVVFATGPNRLRAVATQGEATISDEIELTYQIEPWGKPAKIRIVEAARTRDTVTVEAKLYDTNGVLCLDSRNAVRFSLAGAGRLLDNLGTSRGSRELQLYNGRAMISVAHRGGCTVGVASDGLPPAFLNLS